MQISEAAGGVPEAGAEPCRFPKLEECAHFHYEKVQLPPLAVSLHTNMDQSLHSQHNSTDDEDEYYTLKVTSGDECWLLQRSVENFRMLDAQLHQCIYDRKVSHLPDLSTAEGNVLTPDVDVETVLNIYLEKFCNIANNSLNCGPVLNWLQMDNKGHRLLVPSEESRSINTPAVAAAYSIRRYVSQARDELDLEVGDMISVIDMASPGESIWWRGKRGFKVGFFPQHCVHIIGDKVPRNMPLPPPVVGSLALSPIKPVLRKHGKLIAFFRSFILNRPSRRRLKQSGILKERVFGCDLGEHLLNSGNDIPMVLKCCSEFIEKNGIVDGIYRLSGVTSNIQKLRNAFDEDRIPNLYTEEIVQDIHSVASLLKMYFRELPNPLCTYQLYQSFVNAVQGCNPATRNSDSDHERLLKMREAVQKLPPPHYRTLEYLMRHLAKVAKHGARTGMTTRNVAIVWAPNLLRSEELEGGGVAALQGVGVQAVVTEFLICYTDLIFCDRLPPSVISESQLCSINSVVSSPKRNRPKSLAISTPTKLITLEEARSKHQLNRGDDCGYIEVGGGPKNLPKKYHTVLELPAGRKRYSSGWRSFFSKNRNNSQNTLPKARKASTPGIITAEKGITDNAISDARRKLRTVKSAESLTSGISESATNNEIDSLGPLHTLQKAPGHNRSVSHDSYFDMLQSSQNNSEGSLLDLSEIQLNFDLEESEMRIFSEDESLVSSPRMQKEGGYRKYLMRARQEEFNSAGNSTNPSPKKQARVVMSPDSMSRKRTRLEDQLSDIQYIDCNTPENNACTISITAQVHQSETRNNSSEDRNNDLYTPKNKSPRNSQAENKRQSLNLEQRQQTRTASIPKSLTDLNISQNVAVNQSSSFTPQSPIYKPLHDSSNASTPGDYSPVNDVFYQKLKGTCFDEIKRPDPVIYENFTPNQPTIPKSPTYENVLTTISITYKSPAKRFSTTTTSQSPTTSESIYEDMTVNIEKASVPVEPLAVLPTQEANQPLIEDEEKLNLPGNTEQRPKSLSALEDLKSKDAGNNMRSNLSTSAVCNSKSEVRSLSSNNETLCKSSETTVNSSVSSDFVNTNSSVSNNNYQFIENHEMSPSDLSLSEIVHSSSENLSNNQYSCPVTPTQASLSPNVSPTQNNQISDLSLTNERESFDIGNFNEVENRMDKRKSSETIDENAIYQQVKYFRRSIHEINALLDLGNEKSESTENFNSIELDSLENDVHIYENIENKPEDMEILKEKEILSEEETKQSISTEKISDKDDTEMTETLVTDVEMMRVDKNDDVANDICDKVDVKSLTKNFEVREEVTTPLFKRKEEIVKEKPEICKENVEKVVKDGFDIIKGKVDIVKDGVDIVKGKVDIVKDKVDTVKDKIEIVKEKMDCDQEKMEIVKEKPPLPEKTEERSHSKRNYDKDSVPPCIRLRNLKHAIKTRSLDEDEFSKEFREDNGQVFRRKSLDENLGFVNNHPKTLNPPKHLPENEEKLDIHLSHSVENKIGILTAQNLNRERIEKYKEERRRILHEKYRSESFKEDKDVLMSQLKIKPREETQRKRSESENSTKVFDENDEEKPALEKGNNLKLLAAKFETAEAKIGGRRPVLEKLSPKTEDFEEESLRNRWRNDEVAKSARRRHTFDARERELEAEKTRRVSTETAKSPRKERTSPSLCIKDMKAIFESKSQQ